MHRKEVRKRGRKGMGKRERGDKESDLLKEAVAASALPIASRS